MTLTADRRIILVSVTVITVLLSAQVALTFHQSSSRRLEYGFGPSILADVDGDGLTDIISVTKHHSPDSSFVPITISIFRNSGAGHLQKEASWAVPGADGTIELADLDGDRVMELLVSSHHKESYCHSIYIATFKGWRLNVSERPGEDITLGELGPEGRPAFDTGMGIWVMENGSLDRVFGDDPKMSYRMADLDRDGQGEVIGWKLSNGSLLEAGAFEYRGGRLDQVSHISHKFDGSSVNHWDEYSTNFYETDDSLLYTGGRFIPTRPILLFNTTEQNYWELGARRFGLPVENYTHCGLGIFWDERAGGLAASNASLQQLSTNPPRYHADFENRVLQDFNADGFQDAIITDRDLPGFPVYMSRLVNGNLTYEVQTLGQSLVDRFYTGDLDGDGRTDIGVLNLDKKRVRTFRNDGAGRFVPDWTIDIPAGHDSIFLDAALELCFADLNGDGNQDIVTFNRNWAGSFSVRLGDGKGSFGEGRTYSWGVKAYESPVVIDLTHDLSGDGRPDLVFHLESPQTTVVLLNDGRGGFPDVQAAPVSQLNALGGVAALLLLLPLIWPDGARRPSFLALRLALALIFIIWLVSGVRMPWEQGFWLSILFLPVLITLPFAAAAGRPLPGRSAGILVASSWFFLGGSLFAGTFLQPALASGGVPGWLVSQGPFIIPVISAFAVLSFYAYRKGRGLWRTRRPSAAISPELAEHIDIISARKYPEYTGGYTYLVRENPRELITLRREKGIVATQVSELEGRLVPVDPRPVLERLEREMFGKEQRPVRSGGAAKEAPADARSESGRLVGSVVHYDIPLLFLFIALHSISMPVMFWYRIHYPVFSIVAWMISIGAVLWLLLAVNYRSSARVYENAIDHWGLMGFKRTRFCDIRAVRPMRRYLFGRLGPVYDIARPSHYEVETADGKRFYIAGESAYLLSLAIGPEWENVLDDKKYEEHFASKAMPGRVRAPSNVFGIIVGAVVSAALLGTFFATALALGAFNRAPVMIIVVVPLAGMVLGALAIRALLDWHLGRIIAAKIAVASDSPEAPADIQGKTKQRLRRAASIAVARELPARPPSRREVAGIAAGRGAIAAVMAILLLLPAPVPVQPFRPEYDHPAVGGVSGRDFVYLEVTGEQTIEGKTLDIPGDIIVNGSLSIVNCTLNMSGRFRVGGNLSIAGSSLDGVSDFHPVYNCVRGDASLMLPLDLINCSRAELAFSARYDLNGDAGAVLKGDTRLLWKATGLTTGWKDITVDLGGFCGRQELLSLQPVGWNNRSQLLAHSFTLRTDRGESEPEPSQHGFDVPTVSGAPGIYASNASIRIRDSRLAFRPYGTSFHFDNTTIEMAEVVFECSENRRLSLVRSGLAVTGSALRNLSISLDRSELGMVGCDVSHGMSVPAGTWMTAVDSKTVVDGCTLDLGPMGISLQNTSGALRNNTIRTWDSIDITPVSRSPCRLGEFLEISGNRLRAGYDYYRENLEAFKLFSSIPVTDAADLALKNDIDFKQIYGRYAGLYPRVSELSGRPAECSIYAWLRWQHGPPGGPPAGLTTEPVDWERVGSTYLDSRYPRTGWDGYRFGGDGLEVESLEALGGGLELWSLSGGAIDFLAVQGPRLATASASLPDLRAVTEVISVDMTLEDACDVGVGECDLSYEESTGSIDVFCTPQIYGSTDSVTVVFRYSNGISASERIAGTGGYHSLRLDMPIDAIDENGTLEVSVTAEGAGDLFAQNDKRSWPVEVLRGARTFSADVQAPPIWVLDGAALSFEDCNVTFPSPEAYVFDNGHGSDLRMGNSTVRFDYLGLLGGMNGSAERTCFIGDKEASHLVQSAVLFGPGNWSFLDCLFSRESGEELYIGLGTEGSSIQNCTFTTCRMSSRNIGRLADCVFQDCRDLELQPASPGEISGCLFSNCTVAVKRPYRLPGQVFEDIAISNGTTLLFIGPADIDAVAQNTTISNPLEDIIRFQRGFTFDITSGWLLDLTPANVTSVTMSYTGLSGMVNRAFSLDHYTGGINWSLPETAVDVAYQDASGRHVLNGLGYMLTIRTVFGEALSYAGTIEFGDWEPTRVKLA